MLNKQMFITDLDGTLLRKDQTIADEDRKALERLKEIGVVRVIATGRSVFSLERSIKTILPVDYLIFSTGAGISKYPEPDKHILKKKSLSEDDTKFVIDFLETLDVDYMVQDKIPENHNFSYKYITGNNSDFATRLKFYREYSTPINYNEIGESSQILVIVPGKKGELILATIQEKLSGRYNVIRATSPFDGNTLWIEIFPKKTSKSMAALWLADLLDISPSKTTAIGNDYNDEDLLLWANKSFVVENSPPHLKEKFTITASHNNCGVAEAIKKGFNI